MIITYSLIYSILILILGLLIFNKEATLMILNNISFKWVFERKSEKRSKKNDIAIQIKLNKKEDKNYLSRYIGIRLIIIGCFLLLSTSISILLFAKFQYVDDSDALLYMDDPNLGVILITSQMIITGITIIYLTFKSLIWSDKKFIESLIEKNK